MDSGSGKVAGSSEAGDVLQALKVKGHNINQMGRDNASYRQGDGHSIDMKGVQKVLEATGYKTAKWEVARTPEEMGQGLDVQIEYTFASDPGESEHAKIRHCKKKGMKWQITKR